MIPFIRSISELIAISRPRSEYLKVSRQYYPSLIEDSGQRKRYLRSKEGKILDLPNFKQKARTNWIKNKEKISKLIDDLDYNNQIQSSYDLTLIARQTKENYKDAA